MTTVRKHFLQLIVDTPNLHWLLLTKRPENIARMTQGKLPQNAFPGASVENQEMADERLPHLLEIPGFRWLSVEPLLSPIRFNTRQIRKIDWVVIGGESGPGARPCKIEWIEDIAAQAHAIGAKVFVKQLGTVLTKELFPELAKTDKTGSAKSVMFNEKIRQSVGFRDSPFTRSIR